MEWWQIGFESRDRKVLLPEEDALCATIRGLVASAGAELLLFGIVDDHAHVYVQAERVRAGRLAQALGVVLGKRADTVLRPAWIGPVNDRSHLLNAARYTLRQASHHNLFVPDALWVGSFFQDLVGARWIPGFVPGLWRVLPRLRLRDLFPVVGLPLQPIEPISIEGAARAGMGRVRAAAARAACAGPALKGREPWVVQARGAAARLGVQAGFGRSHISEILECSVRGVGHLLGQEPVPELDRAVRMRLALEDAVSGTKAEQ